MNERLNTPDQRQDLYNERIEMFLNEFISAVYNGQDHIVARKFYRELFRRLIPLYFDICRNDIQKK